jgi:AcrR family transcriptional regulator
MNTDSATDKPVRLRDRLRDEANRAILDAAEEVFSEEGLGARMERIAARAGVAVGTLYNHFQDRQALAAALAATRRAALLARLDGALAESEGKSIREQIRAFVAGVADHAKAHGRYLSILAQTGEGPACSVPGKALVADLTARADLIALRGVASGELRAEGAEFFGLMLVGMIRGANLRALEGGATWDALSEPLVDLFLRGAAR